MEWAALVTWVVTALFGFVMLLAYLRRGGQHQEQGIPAPLLFGHFLLAAGGLVVWIAFLAADSSALAWIAFVDLVVVAVGGWAMFGIWAKHRQRGAASAQAGGVEATAGAPAEQSFPVPVIALHGLFAVATVLLVLLAALGVGDS